MDNTYPIGKPVKVEQPTSQQLEEGIEVFALLPEKIENAIEGCTDADLNKSYREGGWNVSQLVHHLSHTQMNLLLRFQLALTDDNPIVPSFNQDKMVDLEDRLGTSMELSLYLLEELQTKLVMLLTQLTEEEWNRTFAKAGAEPTTIKSALMFYTWHCNHHLAHIEIITGKR